MIIGSDSSEQCCVGKMCSKPNLKIPSKGLGMLVLSKEALGGGGEQDDSIG